MVGEKKLGAPKIPLISNVTAPGWTEKEATDPAYWGRHFRETVRFAGRPHELPVKVRPLHAGDRAGRGALLAGPPQRGEGFGRNFSRRCRAPPARVATSPPAHRARHALVNGAQIDWKAFHAGESCTAFRCRPPVPAKALWMGPKDRHHWLEDSLEKVDDWFYQPV